MYEKTTHDITIQVVSQYLEDQSDADEGQYVWAYHIRIVNDGTETVQLLSRHWRITDGNGTLHEVRGPGVIGEQPVLAPGDSFEYSSGTPLRTSSGIMVGTYEMATRDGRRFTVDIPAFSLDSPHDRPAVN